MTWFYHINGENHGPVAADDLRQLKAGGQIDDQTLVWEQGMPQWAPYGTIAAASVAPTVAVAAAPSGASAAAGLATCSECGKFFPESDLLAYEGRLICPECKPLFFQRVREGVEQPGTFRYASVLTRFGAVFIDGILLDVVVLLPIVLLLGVTALTAAGRSQLSVPIQVVTTVVQYLVPALYEIIMIGCFGATLGKMALKVKVVTAEGGPVGYGRATGRYFAKILSGLILLIGYLMAIWDPEKRALHDRICGTRVITTRT